MRGQVWLRLLDIEKVKSRNPGKHQVGPLVEAWAGAEGNPWGGCEVTCLGTQGGPSISWCLSDMRALSTSLLPPPQSHCPWSRVAQGPERDRAAGL